ILGVFCWSSNAGGGLAGHDQRLSGPAVLVLLQRACFARDYSGSRRLLFSFYHLWPPRRFAACLFPMACTASAHGLSLGARLMKMRDIYSGRTVLALGLLAASLSVQAEPLRVVSSFSILNDMVKEIGGDKVMASTIVPANGDAHSFEPRPSDAKTLASAQLLVINGLEFETWLPRLQQAAGYKGPQVVATEGITPLAFEGGGHEDHAGHDHDHGHNAE